MITLTLIALCGILNAVMDTLDHHFDTSVFKRFNPRFWSKATASVHAKFLPFTKYRVDAWHLAKTAMIISFCAAALKNDLGYHWVIQLVIMGVVYNLFFNLFYNQILKD